ncbi:DNA primase [Streptomyces beigongshangae]|uniref:DNA primase n=1 Tax=Streptomyces beigongshangae TaxID=2841597 RepID=UPI0021A2EEC3|nr:DNA primase [Streptomyces sp. REN17]
MGLAVGAGYVLGRTKKMKLAFAVGTMVAGKRMNLSPRALADLVSQQLQNNPQFKEIGDQLRQDVRGVGKAATGALVERQISGLADRLHGRTNQVKDQLAGVVPDAPRVGGKRRRDEEPDDDHDERDDHDDHDERDGRDGDERYDDAPRDEDEEAPRPRKRAPARKASARKAADERGSDDGAPAKKTARTAKKAPARKAAAAKTATRRTSRARTTRGGGDDD